MSQSKAIKHPNKQRETKLNNPPKKRLNSPTYRKLAIVIKIIALVILVVFGLLFGGFLRFSEEVTQLTIPKNLQKSDGIVVFTGGFKRLTPAIKLLEQGYGKRLLISGVNPSISRKNIEKLANIDINLFNCCVDIGYQATDTIGNAQETADWIKTHNFKKVVLVTNNYHMPRSMLELSNIDPYTIISTYPVINTDLKKTNWLDKPFIPKKLIIEYTKFITAKIRQTLSNKTSVDLAEK